MAKNLNEELYNRFGLDIDRAKVIGGLRIFLANEAWKVLSPMCYPEIYDDPYPKLLKEARTIALEELCRELFLDSSNYYSWSQYEAGKLLEEIFENRLNSIEELLVNTQIFINILYKQKEVRGELDEFVYKIKLYADDFPILGVIVKLYKSRAPQILPSTSPKLDKEILDTLGVLDTEKYRPVLDEFEIGIKTFSKAKN